MLRILFCFALFSALLANAQIVSLATTGDGAQVFFASNFQRPGTDDAVSYKIFRQGADGLTRVAQFSCAESTRFGEAGPCQVNDLMVSRDGATLAYSVFGDCTRSVATAGTGCVPIVTNPFTCGVLTSAGAGPTVLSTFCDGQFALSGNGRYYTDIANQGVYDLQSRNQISFATKPNSQFVGSDGRVLVWSSTGASLVSPNSSLNVALGVPGETNVLGVTANDALTGILYLSPTTQQGQFSLTWHDIATGQERQLTDRVPLAATNKSFHRLTGISDDGSRVAFLAAVQPGDTLLQVYLATTADGAARMMTNVPEGVYCLTLSGNGQVIYAATNANRLLRIDASTGETQEVLPPTRSWIGRLCIWPNPEQLQNAGPGCYDQPKFRPGSIDSLSGSGLSDVTAVATGDLQTSLGGIQLLLNGQPAPLRSVSPTRIEFQTPWEVSGDQVQVSLRDDDDAAASPFLQDLRTFPATIAVAAIAPMFNVSADTGAPVVVHGDFGSLVSDINPARAGEVVHLYGTGFGPVQPAVATGAPGPAAPPAQVVQPLSCSGLIGGVSGSTEPVAVLFAGLAPGLIGYYQVDLQMPMDLPASAVGGQFVNVTCGSAGATASVPYVVAQNQIAY